MKRCEFWDDYDHPSGELEYVVENILFEVEEEQKGSERQRLEEEFSSVLENPCGCLQNCHVDCSHGNNYMYGVELVLNPERLCQDLIYECSETCSCDASCGNRLVQFGPRKALEICDLGGAKGKGVVTLESIPAGAFVCEYAGEILTEEEALKRDQKGLMNYILCLKESSGDGRVSKTFIDPSRRGNIGRYLNHSCEPNCVTVSVRVACPIPRLGIFAAREIKAHEELSFNYGGLRASPEGASKKCFCGAASCTGFLPNLDF